MRFNLNLENDNYKTLETIIQDFEKVNEEFQRQQTQACEKFKVAFEAFMKDFFKLVPQVKQVRWDQYTPYFNDGDSCTFSVNEPYFSNYLHNSDDYDEDDYDEDEDEDDTDDTEKYEWEISTWEIRDNEYEQYGLNEEQKNLIMFVNDMISGNEDFFYEIFGDHQQIVITEKGIEHDYYEHD